MAAATLSPTLRVCDAQGNCTMVPGANYEAAAQAVNSGIPIATVAAQFGGGPVQPFYLSAAALSQPLPAAPSAPAYGTVVNVPVSPATPNVTVPAVAAAIPAPSAPPNYSSAEIPGSFSYTADLETVQQVMLQYGDNWDNAQSIVNRFYAQGVVPGSVTPAMALSALSAVSATATPAAASSLTSPSTWPWYYWAAAAAIGYFALKGK